MAAPAKYLFDHDFAAPKAANTVSLADHQTALGEAETRGYRNGFAAAEQEAATANERMLAHTLERVGQGLEHLTRGLTGVEARLEAEAVDVAVAVAKKLSAELVALEPLLEIAALVTECFRHLSATPHVVVRINDVLYDAACRDLDDIAKRIGFEGRLVVLADPEVAQGDCRIEWADGGMSRDAAQATAIINETVDRFIAARRKLADHHSASDFTKGASDE